MPTTTVKAYGFCILKMSPKVRQKSGADFH